MARRIVGAREFETTDPRQLPDHAESLGPDHDPMPHQTFALTVQEAITSTGLVIVERQFVVDGLRNFSAQGNYGEVTVPGANVFALFLVKREGQEDASDHLMVGARNSIAKAISRQGCVGKHFGICTNVSWFGRNLIFRQKNVPGNTRQKLISETQQRLLPMLETVEEQVARLQNERVWGTAVDREMVDMFERKALPVRYFQPMAEVVRTARNEANALPEEAWSYPEVTENRWNRLGLMHAATRVIQDKASARKQAELSQSVGRFFSFGTDFDLAA